MVCKPPIQILLGRVHDNTLNSSPNETAYHTGYTTDDRVRHNCCLIQRLSAGIIVQRPVCYARTCVHKSERAALNEQTATESCSCSSTDECTNTSLGSYLGPVNVLSTPSLTI